MNESGALPSDYCSSSEPSVLGIVIHRGERDCIEGVVRLRSEDLRLKRPT